VRGIADGTIGGKAATMLSAMWGASQC